MSETTTTIEYTPEQQEYAEQSDLPLVTIHIDMRHCTGPFKDRLMVQGPVPDEFAMRVRNLVAEFETRFDDVG